MMSFHVLDDQLIHMVHRRLRNPPLYPMAAQMPPNFLQPRRKNEKINKKNEQSNMQLNSYINYIKNKYPS